MENLSWTEFEREVKEKQTAILPIGALEAHGPHLPLASDNYIAVYLATRLAERISAFRLPLLPFGQVWSTANYPGTVSLKEQTLISILKDIAQSLAAHGVKLLVLVNSHFGNLNAMKMAAREVMETTDIKCLIFTHPGLKEAAGKYTTSQWCHPSYMHADEIETSMLLAIVPEHVKMELAVKEYPDFPIWFDYTPVRWEKVSSSGVLGDATAATREKGEKILADILDTMVEIYTQYRRDTDE